MLDQKQMYCFKYWNDILYNEIRTLCFKYLSFYLIDLMARRSTLNIIVSYIIFMYAALYARSSRCNCVTTITCNKLPWRWPVFCVSISYITSQPKGQKLMEDEIACDFLPPTTVTMLQTHSMHLYTHTHTHMLWHSSEKCGSHRHRWISFLDMLAWAGKFDVVF